MSKTKKQKRNFLKIPGSIAQKLDRLPNQQIVATCVKSIPVSDLESGKLAHIGISIQNGKVIHETRLIPDPKNGRASKVNVHGKVIVRRDLPKHNKAFSFEAPTWGDWSKGSHTVTFVRKVYPRDFSPPREFALGIEVLSENNGAQKEVLIKFAVDAVFDRRHAKFQSDLLHALNLLQENVGAADIFANTASKEEYMKTVIVDWEILPVGNRDMVITRVMSGFRRKSDMIQAKIAARYDLLNKLGPTAFIQGTNGFRRYFGAKFGDNLVVFENIDYGNAIYVMFDRWEELSKLSRLELLSRNPDGFARIVHRSGWETQLIDLITKRRPPKAA